MRSLVSVIYSSNQKRHIYIFSIADVFRFLKMCSYICLFFDVCVFHRLVLYMWSCLLCLPTILVRLTVFKASGCCDVLDPQQTQTPTLQEEALPQ